MVDSTQKGRMTTSMVIIAIVAATVEAAEALMTTSYLPTVCILK